jgi:hypothetical protein
MAQHFLLSAAARTFSLMALCQVSEEGAYEMFCRMRWPETDGAPVCPRCGCPVAYVYRCRRLLARLPHSCENGQLEEHKGKPVLFGGNREDARRAVLPPIPIGDGRSLVR